MNETFSHLLHKKLISLSRSRRQTFNFSKNRTFSRRHEVHFFPQSLQDKMMVQSIWQTGWRRTSPLWDLSQKTTELQFSWEKVSRPWKFDQPQKFDETFFEKIATLSSITSRTESYRYLEQRFEIEKCWLSETFFAVAKQRRCCMTLELLQRNSTFLAKEVMTSSNMDVR